MTQAWLIGLIGSISGLAGFALTFLGCLAPTTKDGRGLAYALFALRIGLMVLGSYLRFYSKQSHRIAADATQRKADNSAS